MGDQKAAAADAGRLRLHHGERKHHGQGRIHGGPAFAKHLAPSLRRARIGGGNHSPLGKGRLKRQRQQGEDKKKPYHHFSSVPPASAKVVNPSRSSSRARPCLILRTSPRHSYPSPV